MKIKALAEKILGVMVDKPSGYKVNKSGLLLADKDMDASGIRPRWFKVYSVGEGIDYISEDQYVLVAHGRWSNGVVASDIDEKIYLLDNKELLMVSDEKPEGVEFEEEMN
jgi:hypothetical protein